MGGKDARRSAIVRRDMRNSWIGSSFLLMGLTVLARATGFLRDALIAFRFGASSLTDAYLIAFMVPNFIVGLLSGALSAVVVPKVASLVREHNERRAWAIIGTTGLWLLLFTAVIMVLLDWLGPWLLSLLAPGFPPAEVALAVRLLRILLLFILFSGLGYLAGAVLNAYHRFTFIGIAPIAVSGMAVLTLWLLPHPTIENLVEALLAGSVVQFLLQVLPLLREARRHLARVPARDPEVVRMASLSLPVLVSSAVGSGNVIIDRIFGSMLGAGAISDLAFANRVIQVPYGIFGTAVSTVLFPRFVEARSGGDNALLGKLLRDGLRFLLLLTLPVAAFLIALAPQVVDVLFRHGAFTAADANVMAACLQAYAVALPPVSLTLVLTRVFFTCEGNRFVGYASAGLLALNAVGDAVLGHFFLAPGIAEATAVVNWSFLVLLLYALRRRFPEIVLDIPKLTRGALPVLIASAGGLGVASLVAHLLPGGGTLAQLWTLIAGMGSLGIVVGLLYRLFGVPEVWTVWSRLRSRLMPQRRRPDHP